MKRLTQRIKNTGSVITPYCLLEETCDGMGASKKCETCEHTKKVLEKLASYEDAEEQGLLVLFPKYAYFIMDNKIHKGWVQEVVYAVTRKPLYDIRYDDNSLASYSGYIGLTVFLTREEAEVKLKEMER